MVTRTIWSTPGGQFVVLLAAEDADVEDGAAHAVGNAQGGVFHLPRLFAEDGAQEFLLGGEFGFTFGRNFADEDVARADFGAHADHAAFVEVT